MLAGLRERFFERGAIVAGVLSGTSGDGIDVALTRLRARATSAGTELAPPELVHFATQPFEPELAQRVRAVLDGEPADLRACALLARDLGRAFGSAAARSAREHALALDLVGSHGQTVWHHDGVEPSGAATLQLGDGDFVAEACGAAVVSDFRTRDIAAGGEGAPLSALADDLLFAAAPRPCAILNLGGFANLTILRAAPEATLAFDTGPAGSLLDGLARALFERPFDAGGELAARGTPDERGLAWLAEHPFFALPPPKSTGRDTFGVDWVRRLLARFPPANERARCDLLATAVEHVAWGVAHGLERWVPERVGALAVAGGGVHHAGLMRALARRTRADCAPSERWGVPAKAREGLVFAVLAARTVLGISVTQPSVTGARSGRLLGKLSAATAGPAG